MDNTPNTDPIASSLGITPSQTPSLPASIVRDIMDDALSDSATKDFQSARNNIINAIEEGQNAISELASLAQQSQNARTYEVLAKLIETVVAANKDLLDLQTKIREIKNVDEPINGAKTINNNLFVGSTAELQKILKNFKNDSGGDIDG